MRSGALKMPAPLRGNGFDPAKRVVLADDRPSTTPALTPSVGSMARLHSTEQLLRVTSRGTLADDGHSTTPAFQPPAQVLRATSTSPLRPRSRQAKAQQLPEPKPTKAAFKVQHLVLKMSPMPARVRPQIVDVAAMLKLEYEGTVWKPALKLPVPILRGDAFDPIKRGAQADDRPSTAPPFILSGATVARPRPAEAPRRKEVHHAMCKSGVLHVTILSCSELPRSDANSSDPYSPRSAPHVSHTAGRCTLG
jgi:hypothetical protein